MYMSFRMPMLIATTVHKNKNLKAEWDKSIVPLWKWKLHCAYRFAYNILVDYSFSVEENLKLFWFIPGANKNGKIYDISL